MWVIRAGRGLRAGMGVYSVWAWFSSSFRSRPLSFQTDILAYFHLDQEQRALRAGLDAAERRLIATLKKTAKIKQEQQELATLLLTTKAKEKNVEVSADALAAKVADLREKMNRTNNNKDYQGLLVDIGTLQKQKEAADEEGLALLTRAEELEAKITEAAGRAADQAKIVELAQKEVLDARAELGDRLDQTLAKRDAAGGNIPAKVMDLYNKLAERLDGEVVAGIEIQNAKRHEYTCQGCSIALPRQAVNALLNQPETPTVCASCGRLLVMSEEVRETVLEGK